MKDIKGDTQTIMAQIESLIGRLDENELGSVLAQAPSEYSFMLRRYMESASTYAASTIEREPDKLSQAGASHFLAREEPNIAQPSIQILNEKNDSPLVHPSITDQRHKTALGLISEPSSRVRPTTNNSVISSQERNASRERLLRTLLGWVRSFAVLSHLVEKDGLFHCQDLSSRIEEVCYKANVQRLAMYLMKVEEIVFNLQENSGLANGLLFGRIDPKQLLDDAFLQMQHDTRAASSVRLDWDDSKAPTIEPLPSATPLASSVKEDEVPSTPSTQTVVKPTPLSPTLLTSGTPNPQRTETTQQHARVTLFDPQAFTRVSESSRSLGRKKWSWETLS